MYETCGRLYAAGLESCGVFDLAMKTWEEAFGEDTVEQGELNPNVWCVQ